jgi:hypothetical protein
LKAADFAAQPRPNGKPLSRRFMSTDRHAIDTLFARLVAIMESENGGT